MKKKILKDTLALLAITLVAALCLSVVYMITKDKIEEAQKDERMASFRDVMPDVEFEQIEKDIIEAWNKDDAHKGTISEAHTAKDKDGKFAGIVVSSVSRKGYGGNIVLSVGVDKDGKITGVEVTSMSETSGLGANCLEEEWVSQFKGKSAETLGYVKNGDPGESEIDALTSATITTKAVLEAVNNGTAFARAEIAKLAEKNGG